MLKLVLDHWTLSAPRAVQIANESTTDTETESQEDPEPASNTQMREMDSIVSAMEADETTSCDVFSRPRGEENSRYIS